MLSRILNPYRVFVSPAARAAGFKDQSFATKKAARGFVREVQKVDPAFNPTLRLTFRYYDTTTGNLYASRLEYELEEARRKEWLEQYEAKRTEERNGKLMETHQPDNAPEFGPIIYAYSRSQAVADGFQVEVSKVAREAGITFPVFLTRTVYDKYVVVPPGVAGQDEAGRLWDIVWMTRFAIRKAQPGQTRLPVALYVRNDNHRARLIKLIASCGPLDMDDPQPAITIMMPDED